MPTPQHSIVFWAPSVVGAANIAIGDVLIPASSGSGAWVIASAANRTTRGSEGVALSVGGGSGFGPVEIQQAGTLDATVSGLGAGAKQLVRTSSAGRLERIASYTSGDDVVGYAEADGRVHLHFGLPWAQIEALAGGGSSVGAINEVQLSDGAGGFLAATRVTGGTDQLGFGTGTKPAIGALRFAPPAAGLGNTRVAMASRSVAGADRGQITFVDSVGSEAAAVFGSPQNYYTTLVGATCMMASSLGANGAGNGTYFGMRPDGLAFLSLGGGANKQFEMSSNIITDYALEIDPNVTGVVELKTSSLVTAFRCSFYRGGAPVRWLNANSLGITLGYAGGNAVPIRLDATTVTQGGADADLLTTIKPAGVQTTSASWTTVYSVNLTTADNDAISEFWFRARAIRSTKATAVYFERHRAFRMQAGALSAYPETLVRSGGDTIVADARITYTGTTVELQVSGDAGLTLDWTCSLTRERSVSSGATPFSPATDTSSTCRLWLRGDLGLTESGGLVTNWNDQSGSADSNRNATASGSARPGFTASNASYNNRQTVNFTSSAQRMATGTWSAAVTQSFTVFVVGRAISSGSNAYWWESLNGASHLRENNSSGLIAYAGTVLADGTTNAPAVTVVTYNGATTIIRNSQRSATVTGAAGSGGITGMYLGNETGSGGYLNGEVAEYIVYSGLLSGGDMTAVLNYLEARYGIALAA